MKRIHHCWPMKHGCYIAHVSLWSYSAGLFPYAVLMKKEKYLEASNGTFDTY